jgi:hypothetical protein
MNLNPSLAQQLVQYYQVEPNVGEVMFLKDASPYASFTRFVGKKHPVVYLGDNKYVPLSTHSYPTEPSHAVDYAHLVRNSHSSRAYVRLGKGFTAPKFNLRSDVHQVIGSLTEKSVEKLQRVFRYLA